jgi:selenide, water dikinase
MQPSRPVETDIVLLGAGHAHVEVLRRFVMQPQPGVRLTLIAREPEALYSGMLPGLIRGDYTYEQAHIDLAPLTALARARLIFGEATAFDPIARTVSVAERPDVPFDILSVDVGGLSAIPRLPDEPVRTEPAPTVAQARRATRTSRHQANQPILPEAEDLLTDVRPIPRAAPEQNNVSVKPIGRFLDKLAHLQATLTAGARIAVIGGGPGGSELALALVRRFDGLFRVLLVSATPDPIPTAPPSARRAMRQALVDAGVELVFGVTASGLRDGLLLLSDGSSIEAEAALWATGVVGPGILAASGVACDEAGCIRVSNTLASISHPHVFAAGDCAALEGNPRPKAGAWAVRAGAPLAENLRRAALRQRLKPWRPRKDAPAILGLGDGRAVAWRNGVSVQGRLVWRVKDWIDRRWMRVYSDMRMPANPDDPMRCGGCGAKVSADVLADVLGSLAREPGPELLDAWDDASVVRPPAGKLLVQSIDHFRGFIDDPYILGQIAAAHALSDIHAMGADPWTAMAIASVPYAPGEKMRADLSAMLQGAQEVLRGDGCTLVGGHSAEAAEAALGFAVTGLVGAGAALRKSGLRSGDRLILTKPLGTGIIFAGQMRGLTRAVWLQAAIQSMRTTNGEAGRILRGFSPHGATDVTGFGLAGHLREMLEASGVAATLWLDAIPALPGAMALAMRGVESTLAESNRRWLGRAPGTELLVDPQTSGGLLVGIPANRAAACLQALRDASIAAAEIGEVEVLQEGQPLLRLEQSGTDG